MTKKPTTLERAQWYFLRWLRGPANILQGIAQTMSLGFLEPNWNVKAEHWFLIHTEKMHLEPEEEKPVTPSPLRRKCQTCHRSPAIDYGDFKEYEVRTLVADYCRSVTLGLTGWGLSFIDWVEVRGIAKFDSRRRLIRLRKDKHEP